MNRHFLLIFFGTVTFLLLAQGAFNLFVDPYGFSGTLRNASFKHQKVHKPFIISQLELEEVIIGNSRNFYAFEPQSDNSYNFSLPGIHLDQIKQLLQHAILTTNIQRALITVDTICDPDPDIPVRNNVDERFLVAPTKSELAIMGQNLLLFTSLDTTESSLNLLYRGYGAANTDKGRRKTFNESGYQKNGEGYTLRMRESRSIEYQLGLKRAATFEEYQDQCKTENLDDLIALAIEHNIEIVFFLNPVHARYWYLLSLSGQLETDHLYKKKLIHKQLQTIPEDKRHLFYAYDFVRFNEFTTEKLTYLSPGYDSRFWFECSHMKVPLADNLLALMNSKTRESTQIGANMFNLDVDKDYRLMLKELQQWKEQYPNSAEEVDSSFLKVTSIINQ